MTWCLIRFYQGNNTIQVPVYNDTETQIWISMFNLLWPSDVVWRNGVFVNTVSANGTKPLPEPNTDLVPTEPSGTNPKIYEYKSMNYSIYSTEIPAWWRHDMETLSTLAYVNTLRPRQNGRHFADHIFNCILLNENVWILIKISLKFVPKNPINNIPALVQIMAWRRPGDKPLSEPMMVNLPTHICVTRPQYLVMHL